MTDPAARPAARGRRFLSWLAVSSAGLAGLVAGLLVLQWRQTQDLEASARLRADSVTALTFQFEREYLRLRHAVDVAVHAPTPPDADALALRYDIFLSRKALLQDNPSIELLKTRPEYSTLVPRLDQIVAVGDPLFGQAHWSRQAMAAFLQQLDALGTDVQALSLASNSVMTGLIEARQKTIQDQNTTIQQLTLAQLVLLLVVAGALWARNQRQMRERAELEALALALRDAHLKAEAANQGKTRFLANMSHELRTPFNGVLGMLTLLEGSHLNAEQTDHVRTARESAQHLLTLLNDILDVSAMEAGKLKLQPEAVSLPQLLTDVQALMQGPARDKGLLLAVEMAPGLPVWVQTDPTRLKQILFNLLSNGIKFTTQGEVRLRIEPAGPQHLVAPLRFTVTDTGIGMDQAALGRLFQRFYQVESHASRRFGGTGLGLEISRTLARMMGGDLTARSTPANGSVFTLDVPLPLAKAPPEPDRLPSPAAQVGRDAPFSGRRVLVAEDHPVNRKLMAALLQRLGCEATFCENGQEAVEAVSAQAFDLVLMDIHMPVMDGLSATRSIRLLQTDAQQLPIIALTADVMNEAREKALDAGVNEFLSKPVRLPELTAAMGRWLHPAS